MADHDIGENDDARADEDISLYFHALRSPEVGDDHSPHADYCSVLDGDKVRARGL
jgi:hypothetical protein